MGGYATWDVAMKIPDIPAALVPICGRANVRQAEILKDMPIWMFHGDADEAVPVRLGDAIYDKLKELGSDIKYTRYEGVGHDSWTQTYENDEMWEWLTAQKRS